MAASQDPETFETTVDNLLFRITLITHDQGNKVIRIEAEDVGVWVVDLEESQLQQLNCANAEDAMALLLAAFQRRSNSSVTVTQTRNTVALKITWEWMGRSKSSTITLQPTEMPVETRIERSIEKLSRKINSIIGNDADRLSARLKHPNLELFHNGKGVVKARGGNEHDSVLIDTRYTSGQHYWEVRIIRSASNYIMIGVQDVDNPLTPYPGRDPFASRGKSFYANNGHIYENNGSRDYGIGGFITGCYVGTLLDMNAKTVRFSVNGIAGAPISLPADGYYFVVNLHTNTDAVEIIPEYCWHKN